MSHVLQISMRKIDRVKKRFVEGGLDAALYKRTGNLIYAKKTEGDFEAHLMNQMYEDRAFFSLLSFAIVSWRLITVLDLSHTAMAEAG